jgi:hypothetical protein
MAPRSLWPRWTIPTACLAWLFFSFLVFSDPVVGLYSVAARLCLSAGFGLIWLRLWISFFHRSLNLRVPNTSKRPPLSTLFAFPAVVLVVIAALLTDAPVRARFSISEASLNSYADSIERRSSPTEVQAYEWVGLYRARSAFILNGCVHIATSKDFTTTGFARCDARPQAPSEYIYAHFMGDWWVWENLLGD